jgi:hypothetical protein
MKSRNRGAGKHTLTASSNALAISFKSLSKVLIFPAGLIKGLVQPSHLR